MSERMTDALMEKLVGAIESDPVALEQDGFPAEQIDELKAALAESNDDDVISAGLALLQIATGLSNLGHETPVDQLKVILDELGPRLRALAAERGANSDAAHLDEAARAVGQQKKPLPAKPGDAKPEGSVSVQAFKIPVR